MSMHFAGKFAAVSGRARTVDCAQLMRA